MWGVLRTGAQRRCLRPRACPDAASLSAARFFEQGRPLQSVCANPPALRPFARRRSVQASLAAAERDRLLAVRMCGDRRSGLPQRPNGMAQRSAGTRNWHRSIVNLM
jgi:hypothetical protein